MGYQVLARKYRPQRFADVAGQDHVTVTLMNALRQNRIAHGYIFSGHRGIGKTTIARILAMALNCRNAIGSEFRAGNAVDVIEIDAATNRGIDEIRELRDAARYRPARDKYKIYILDEAHQITDAAFNALLKTLEEPPGHVVFMMATTQPEDFPQTIRSRCQHFSFHAVKYEDILTQLREIAGKEEVDAEDAALALLAEAGDGSMRDALSIMDQAIASAPQTSDGRPHVELTEVRELMGAVSNVVFEEILSAVHNNDSATVLATVGHLLDLGNGPQQIARQFVRFLRNCVVAKITALAPEGEAHGIAAELLQISVEERRRAARSAQNFSEEELSRFLSILLRTFDDLGYRQEQRLHLELGLLKLVHVQRLVPIEEILSQLGATATPNAPKPPAPSAPRTPQTTPPQAARTAAPRTTAPLTAPFPRPQAPPPAIPPVPKIPQLVGPPPARTGGDREPQEPGESTKPGAPFNRGADEWASQQPSNLNRPKIGSEDLASQAWTSLQPNDPEPPQAANAAPPVTTDGKASPQPEPPQLIVQPAPTSDASHLQTTVVRALLNTKGQTSAAEQLEDANWAFTGNTLKIQTTR